MTTLLFRKDKLVSASTSFLMLRICWKAIAYIYIYIKQNNNSCFCLTVRCHLMWISWRIYNKHCYWSPWNGWRMIDTADGVEFCVWLWQNGSVVMTNRWGANDTIPVHRFSCIIDLVEIVKSFHKRHLHAQIGYLVISRYVDLRLG